MRRRRRAGDHRPIVSKRRSVDLFWLLGAPVGVMALLFALGAHF